MEEEEEERPTYVDYATLVAKGEGVNQLVERERLQRAEKGS